MTLTAELGRDRPNPVRFRVAMVSPQRLGRIDSEQPTAVQWPERLMHRRKRSRAEDRRRAHASTIEPDPVSERSASQATRWGGYRRRMLVRPTHVRSAEVSKQMRRTPAKRSWLVSSLFVVQAVWIVVVAVSGLWVVSNTGSTGFTEADAERALAEEPLVPARTPARAAPAGGAGSGDGANGGDAEGTETTTSGVPRSNGPDHAAPTSAPDEQLGVGYRVPPQGVYTFTASGYAELKGTLLRHDYPPETYPVVRHLGGCEWRLEHAVVREVVDALEFCSSADSVSLLRWRFERRFVGINSVVDLVCSDPAIVLTSGPMGARPFECRDENEDVTVKGEIVQSGGETVTLTTGEQIEAAAVAVTGELSGSLNGAVEMRISVDVETGLWLQEDRRVDREGSPKYEERSSFLLRSRSPSQSPPRAQT